MTTALITSTEFPRPIRLIAKSQFKVTKAWYGNKWVAMKTFPTQQTKSLKQGWNEAEMLQQFASHPYVVTLISVFENKEDKTLIILEELFNNGSLFDCLYRHQKKLNIIQRLRILIHVSEALICFHSAGYIHRDIKSPNILLDDGFAAKVGDLGIMRKLVTNKNQVEEDEKCEMTHIGTPLWVAPEILERQAYNSKADIYSLGVVMYEVTENTLPTSRVRPDSVNSHNIIASLMKMCLHSDPQERPTAKQVKYQLQGALKNQCHKILQQSLPSSKNIGWSGYGGDGGSESGSGQGGNAIELIYEEYKRKPVDRLVLFKPVVAPAVLKVM